MPKKKTYEEFVNEVYDIVGNEYTVLGEYINTNTRLMIKHNICNHHYEVKPANFLSGKRCPECSKKIVASKNTLSHDQFIEKVVQLYGNIYEFLNEYQTAKTKIKVKHLECGHVWDVLPYHLTEKKNKAVVCPNCNGGIQRTKEEFINKLINLVGDEYVLLNDYVNSHTHVKLLHNTPYCMYEYEVTPNHFINGTRCPACFGKNKKTTEEFKLIVREKEEDNYIVIGEYLSLKIPIKMKHNIENCGCIFEIAPAKFIHRDQRCPVCSSKSKGEIRISEFLKKNNVLFKKQYYFNDFRDSYLLRFDFGILKNNKLIALIEYDGVQHFEPVDFAGKGEKWAKEQFEMTKQRDNLKNEYCKENSIPLVRIPYWKYDEIESILNNLIHNDFIAQ